MSIDIDTSELLAVAADLDRVGPGVGARAALAIRKTAYDIERDAKTRCPVDTGNLRNSISSTITGDGRTLSIQAEVGPTAEYGAFVEDGTSRHAPQPYMSPAFDAAVPRLLTALNASVVDELL